MKERTRLNKFSQAHALFFCFLFFLFQASGRQARVIYLLVEFSKYIKHS